MKFMAKGLKWYRLEKKRISREEWEKVMYELDGGDVAFEIYSIEIEYWVNCNALLV